MLPGRGSVWPVLQAKAQLDSPPIWTADGSADVKSMSVADVYQMES